jgi:hypothetical protein
MLQDYVGSRSGVTRRCKVCSVVHTSSSLDRHYRLLPNSIMLMISLSTSSDSSRAALLKVSNMNALWNSLIHPQLIKQIIQRKDYGPFLPPSYVQQHHTSASSHSICVVLCISMSSQVGGLRETLLRPPRLLHACHDQ